MSTVYNAAKQLGLIQTNVPAGFKWANVSPNLKFLDGGPVDWSTALIDSGKTVSQITLMGLSPDEVNAICSKLDIMFNGVQNQAIANMVAEEILNILAAIEAVKWQTQSAFGGILAQGTQLDIWPLRPKDVGGTLLNPAATGSKGLYGGTTAAVYSWLTTGLTGGTAANIIPSQIMWQYAGMIYLGGVEKMYNPIVEGIQFTLAGIASPAQPVTKSVKKTFGENSEISYFRLEKPVLIPPLKTQAVSVMPDTSGDTNFELIALVIAQSQNKSL